MLKRSQCSENAKAQRSMGNCFSPGLTDDIPLAKLLDPDFKLESHNGFTSKSEAKSGLENQYSHVFASYDDDIEVQSSSGSEHDPESESDGESNAEMTDNTRPEPNESNTIPVYKLLDITVEDDIEDLDLQSPQLSVNVVVEQLLKDAKEHQAFHPWYQLEAVKAYLKLCIKFNHNPKILNPWTRASLAVAKLVGKGPYFAKKIQHLAIYIDQFYTLPPMESGKHHAHPLLLNDEHIMKAVCHYLTVIPLGDVSIN
ncbi:hypothetical protein H0H87_003992 [Tephrocybe sp. NHM501043]|nr:hypothetical protein H0H87_003992 [Tephrocybe sp. NHM501043]